MERIRIVKRPPKEPEGTALGDLLGEAERIRKMAEKRNELLKEFRSVSTRLDTVLLELNDEEFTCLRITINYTYLSTSQLQTFFDSLQKACQYVLQTENFKHLSQEVRKNELKVDFLIKDIVAGSQIIFILLVSFYLLQVPTSSELTAAFIAEYIKTTISQFKKVFGQIQEERPQDPIGDLAKWMEEHPNVLNLTIQMVTRNNKGKIFVVNDVGLGEFDESALQFIANSNSKIIHAPNCKIARRTAWNSKSYFSNVEAAMQAGFQPHRSCLPHVIRKS